LLCPSSQSPLIWSGQFCFVRRHDLELLFGGPRAREKSYAGGRVELIRGQLPKGTRRFAKTREPRSPSRAWRAIKIFLNVCESLCPKAGSMSGRVSDLAIFGRTAGLAGHVSRSLLFILLLLLLLLFLLLLLLLFLLLCQASCPMTPLSRKGPTQFCRSQLGPLFK